MDKRLRKRSAIGLSLPVLPQNVFPFQAGTRSSSRRYILYLASRDSLLESIKPSTQGQFLALAENQEQFSTTLKMGLPDLILIDSEMEWSQPLEMIDWLHDTYGMPIVLMVRKKFVSRRRTFIRKAYSAGITDVVYLPFANDELSQTVSVLLRARERSALITGG